MNIYQIVAIGGMLSPIIYTATWILGGILQSDYSHIRDDISSLYAVDAPNQRLYQSLIIINSVLLFVFFLGLHEGINDGGSAIVGPVILLISAAIGILVALFFPLDAGGELITFRGKMHLILVVTMGILQIGGMVALWFRLQSVPGWSAFAIYSLLSAIISFILVIVAGIYATSKYRGLIERIMVSPYQLYYFVLSLMVFLNN
ncbi:MAG: DUF998 domain-containing protein [Candidatus Hodarchaeales archaeon]|jgi:hypothetical protein